LIIPGVAAEISGPASLLAWGIMALMVVPMALTIGLLAAQHPNSGGVSYFVAKAFSPRTGAFIGWYFIMAVVVGAPVLALTGAGYFCAAFGVNGAFRLPVAALLLLVSLLSNHFGIRLTGAIQMIVVSITLMVLALAILVSLPRVEPSNFKPFMPNGLASIGFTSTALFWCFIGWEAVSNLSAEFENPGRDAVKGSIIAALIISLFYFMTAFVVVGTHSFGPGISDTALVHIIKGTMGPHGAAAAGLAALLICVAPAIAYTGAISRMIHSLAEGGYAPSLLAISSKKHQTPLGGLCFLAGCYALLLAAFSTRYITISTLIQLPGAAFILTYLGASAAGIKLLHKSKLGRFSSILSFALSFSILLCVKWTLWYPVLITCVLALYLSIKSRSSNKKQPEPVQQS
jgi:amino acid efflux transporter